MLNLKEIPIINSTPMVQAVLDGRKTQTRRLRGLKGLDNYYFQSLVHHATGHFSFVENGNYSPKEEDVKVVKCPYGKSGDLIWVRETHSIFRQSGGTIQREKTKYKADPQWDSNSLIKWIPSIHMPKIASRIWLMVEDIVVERLQYINDEEAKSEGVLSCIKHDNSGTAYFDYSGRIGAQGFNFNSAKKSFITLWESINGPDSWKQNPWVWVVKFRTLSTTGRPSDEAIRDNYLEVTGQEVTNA